MYDFKSLEKETLEFWKKHNIYNKQKNPEGKPFFFMDGPPYTSGRLHLGHAWNYSLKDMIQRYKRMQGFDVFDRNGFDMHGLPTENKVQELLKLKNKKEIEEKIGIPKFIEECKKFSLEMASHMVNDFKKLGIWMDFENAYMPITNDFIETEWYFIKE